MGCSWNFCHSFQPSTFCFSPAALKSVLHRYSQRSQLRIRMRFIIDLGLSMLWLSFFDYPPWLQSCLGISKLSQLTPQSSKTALFCLSSSIPAPKRTWEYPQVKSFINKSHPMWFPKWWFPSVSACFWSFSMPSDSCFLICCPEFIIVICGTVIPVGVTWPWLEAKSLGSF